MKKIKITLIALAVLCTASHAATAAEIPIEAAPCNATKESITVTENLISDILTEVENGLGYGEANGKAQAVICNAVIENKTDGFGYADLMSIARNSIFLYRDMYLRPELYEAKKETVYWLICDLIADVGNGKNYNNALDKAYTRIYQSVSFLIPNDNSINGFIHNFEMAKLLFDANGVSPKYQSDSHILLRALLSKYNALTDIKYHITDKKEKENSLKNMLASDPVVRSAFAEWLSLPTEADIYNKLLDEIAKESPIPVGVNDFDKKLHQLLYKTTDLIDWMQQHRAIRYKNNYISRPSSSYDWIYVYGYSNEIITELIARGWSCENTCNIGEEPNKKDIPYYWSAAGREIDVSKIICYDGNTVLQRCSVGSEEITLTVGDTIIEALNYNELVTDGSGVKKFVDDIEKKYNDIIRGGI